MSKGSQAVVEAVRSVLEPLERRRLLTGSPSIEFSASGTRPYVEFSVDTGLSGEFQFNAAHVTNLTQDADVAITPISTTNEAYSFRWGFTNALSTGWYEAYVRDGSLESDEYEKTFSFLSADFDGNHTVDFTDFSTLQNNFGLTPATFAQGDANYDHTVDFNDYLVLQNSFGQTLPALSSEPGSVSVANTSPGTLTVGWTANTDVRDGFKVYRSDDWGNNYSLVQTIADPDARTWTDAGTPASPLTIGKTYWYRVRAYTTAAGASASTQKASGVVPQPAPTAVATPDTVTGTTTQLGVLGDTADPSLKYTWTRLSGPAAVTFGGTQNTHAAKNTLATFTKAGTYTFNVAVRDGFYNTVVSQAVTVQVVPTAATVQVTPSDVTLPLNGSMGFTAYVTDQFGQPVTDPLVTWQIQSGSGSMSGSTYTAPATAGTAVIRGTCGLISASAMVAIENASPALDGNTYQATTGTTATLSVNGIDDGGDANLVYTWSIEGKPDGAADPVLSANASNSAKQTIAAFSKAGFYEFNVTADDGEHTTSLQYTVSVQALPTTLIVDPPSPTVTYWTTAHFTASAKDQFAQPIADPQFQWSAQFGTITYGDYTANFSNHAVDHVVVQCGAIQKDVAVSLQTPGDIQLTYDQTNNGSGILRWVDSPQRDDVYKVAYSKDGVSFGPLSNPYEILQNASDYSVDMTSLIQANYYNFTQIQNIFFRVIRVNGPTIDYSNVVTVPNPYFGLTSPGYYDIFPQGFNLVTLGQKPYPGGNVGEFPMANGVPSVVTYSLSRYLIGLPNASGAASVTVNLSSYGTATPGVDFTFRQAVTIPAGASSVDFDVTILPDNEAEYWYESFQIAARPGPNSTVSYNPSSLVNIFDGTPNLHIDSNNDGKNDWNYSSSTAFLDDSIESDPNLPGKYIDVSNTDANGDWIPDFAEGFSLPSGASNPSATGVKFVPVTLQLSPYSNFSTTKVTFTYDASDPASVVIPGNPATAKEWDYKPAPGSLRLWKRDGTASRNGRPINQGGDFIQPGVSYTIAELGGFTLYVEAVAPAAAGYGQKLPISVQLSVNGSPATPSDTVNVTPVYNPDGWRAVARKEAGFDLRIWNPTSGYSASNREQWKKIYAYYEKLYDDDYQAHGSGATLGYFQWMGLAKVAGKTIVESADLMNSASSFGAAISTTASNLPKYFAIANYPDPLGIKQWLYNSSILASVIAMSPAATTNLNTHLKETQIVLMEGGFAIFNDAAWQHVAYRDGGIAELRRLGDKSPDLPGTAIMATNPDKTVNVLEAWELIDKGDPTSIWAGNRQLINNEQNVTLKRYFAVLGSQNMLDASANPLGFAFSKSAAMTLGSQFGRSFSGASTYLEFAKTYWYYGYTTPTYVTDDPSRWRWVRTMWQQWKAKNQIDRFNHVSLPIP